jgi:small subunit ribosomal protein S18
MARGGNERTRRSPKDAARKTKKKPCALCRDKIEWVDYKDVGLLRKYMSDRGKIRARRVTGNCTQHQREIALAIKTAREVVLLPYTQRTMTERSGGRGRPRGDRGGDSEFVAPEEANGARAEEELEVEASGEDEVAAAVEADADSEGPDAGLVAVSGNGAGTGDRLEPEDGGAESNGSGVAASDEEGAS